MRADGVGAALLVLNVGSRFHAAVESSSGMQLHGADRDSSQYLTKSLGLLGCPTALKNWQAIHGHHTFHLYLSLIPARWPPAIACLLLAFGDKTPDGRGMSIRDALHLGSPLRLHLTRGLPSHVLVDPLTN